MRSHVAATLLLAALAKPATAQTTVDPRLTVAVTALRPGLAIRIASTGTLLDGRFRNARSDSLIFTTAYGEKALALTAIDTLWAGSRATGRGAAIGGLLGGVALAALSVALVSDACNFQECANRNSDYATAMGIGLALGGTGGALLGASVGWVSHRWRRVYP